jgi:NADH-quinone oxidoreductase subunit M
MSPLLLLILLPLFASLFIAVGANARRTALGAAFLNLILSIFLFARYDLHAGGWQFVSEWHVVPRLGINLILGADGLTLCMLLLSTLVTFSALWVAPKIEKQEGLYYIALLFISAGVIGAFSSLDVLFLYSFHELALIPTFLLIGIWGSGDRQAAAWKATIYLGTGSFVLLIGLLALYISMPAGVRTFDLRQMTDLAANGHWNTSSPVIYLLLLIGFGTLVSLFPFHSWAPPAYASAPAPAAMLHAGVLKKFGLYGLIRIALPLFPPAVHDFFNPLLLILIIGNIGYIGYVTVAQKRLDWTIGYSSVMHMGYIFLGLAAYNLFGTQRRGTSDVRPRSLGSSRLCPLRGNPPAHRHTRLRGTWWSGQVSSRVGTPVWVCRDGLCRASRIRQLCRRNPGILRSYCCSSLNWLPDDDHHHHWRLGCRRLRDLHASRLS